MHGTVTHLNTPIAEGKSRSPAEKSFVRTRIEDNLQDKLSKALNWSNCDLVSIPLAKPTSLAFIILLHCLYLERKGLEKPSLPMYIEYKLPRIF